jgi:hypothetical protein
MATALTLRASLFPFLLLATGSTSRCELSTDSGTGELHIVGTVNFREIEGGCWQVVATDGGRYELRPGQAPASVLRDGARVALVVRLNEDRVSACQVGTPIDVWRVVEVDT